MKIKNEKKENGYLITEFENGTIVKEIISNHREEIIYSKEKLFNAQVLNKLDYIECLAELNQMKGAIL